CARDTTFTGRYDYW
nr:immunoglobulin heavy chain junction region [Macaca mulatta]MOX60630.1 immunoglobulin heavy chain junction region [Macaca mulatta]MOX62529.1 immunoglobulin heavy chain junction region [Macaca mulatta]MOX68291.1 immunoglobulin heavy chain junction region [Macaca mulatta]MOX68703.1 immunoglobulin heavy chain junction region [Macaca mulatta]